MICSKTLNYLKCVNECIATYYSKLQLYASWTNIYTLILTQLLISPSSINMSPEGNIFCQLFKL